MLICMLEMKVLTQKIFVVFLVSVQCSGVTDDFEADCTITDNIKKIVRRLRLSSSKPFGDDLELNMFGTEGNIDLNDIQLPTQQTLIMSLFF